MFAITSSCSVFNDIYYKQIASVTMGSPLGLHLSIFLAYYEHKWLENCPLPIKPKIYYRNINNIILMFDKKNHVNKFLKYMNIFVITT